MFSTNSENRWICPFCSKNFKTRRLLAQHKKELHYNIKHEYVQPPGGNCQYCNKECKFKNTLTLHEKYCKLNPNRIKCKGHSVSEETKEKIRQAAKNSNMGGYRKGAGYKNVKKGYYKGYWCDSSWELAFLIYCLEHNITIKRNEDKFPYVMDNEIHYYVPDFIVGSTYIEIKGRIDDRCQYKFEQFPSDKKLKIYYEQDIKCFLNYVYNKYGKEYYTLFDGQKPIIKPKVKKENNINKNKIKVKQKRPKSKTELNYEYYKENGLLDNRGYYNAQKYSCEIWEERKQKIINSGINLMKFGCVGKVMKQTGLTKRTLEDTIEHFWDYFKDKIFRRK